MVWLWLAGGLLVAVGGACVFTARCPDAPDGAARRWNNAGMALVCAGIAACFIGGC